MSDEAPRRLHFSGITRSDDLLAYLRSRDPTVTAVEVHADGAVDVWGGDEAVEARLREYAEPAPTPEVNVLAAIEVVLGGNQAARAQMLEQVRAVRARKEGARA